MIPVIMVIVVLTGTAPSVTTVEMRSMESCVAAAAKIEADITGGKSWPSIRIACVPR